MSFQFGKAFFQELHRLLVNLHHLQFFQMIFNKILCKHSHSGSHFNNQVVVIGKRVDNLTRDVQIDQKMLSEGFFRPHQIVICVVSHSHYFISSRKRR